MEERVDTAYRVFVSYIDKSREYYAAQGYETPYRWAYHRDAPFAPLAKPLPACRVGLVTTATLVEGDDDVDPDDRPAKFAFAAPIDPPPPRLYTADLSWDKDATHTNDLDSFFPLRRLQEFVVQGRIGGLSRHFYGAPTEYSQRRTREEDAPAILGMMQDDGVDAAVLVGL